MAFIGYWIFGFLWIFARRFGGLDIGYWILNTSCILISVKPRIKNFLGNKFVKGGVVFTLANIFVSLFNYLFNSLSAKALGPQGYGEIAALFAYLSIVSVPLGIISTLIIQKLGSVGETRAVYALSFDTWFRSRVRKWWFLFLLPILAIPIVPRITNLSLIASVGLSSIISITMLTGVYMALIQGLQLFISFSVLSIIQTLIKLIGAILVFWKLGNISTIIFFLVVGNVATYILARLRISSLQRAFTTCKHITFNKRIVHIMRRKQTIIAVCSLISIALLSNADIIFVKKFFSPADAGFYGVWSLFAKILIYIAGPLISVLFIFFADSQQKRTHGKLLTAITTIFLLGTAFSFVVYQQFGNVLLSLIANKSYSPVLNYLPMAALFGGLYGLITIYNNYFIAQNSKGALINTFTVPLYIVSLFIFGHTLQNVVWINIYYGAFVVITTWVWLFVQRNNTI